MGYLKILLTFLASYIAPGLGFLLLGKTKRFLAFYFTALLLTLPSFLLLRVLAEHFPKTLAPALGLCLILFYVVVGTGIFQSTKLATQAPYRTQRTGWQRGLLVMFIAFGTYFLSAWMSNYTKHYLFDTITLEKGGGLAPRLQEGDRVLVLRPLHGIEKNQIVVFRNPESTKQVLLLEVAGLEGDLVIGTEKEYEVGSEQVLLSYGSNLNTDQNAQRYFGPFSLDSVEGVVHQIYWSREQSRIFSLP